MKNDNRLKHISNGAVDFYIALKFESKINYDELCGFIQLKIDDYLKMYNSNVRDYLITTLQTALSDLEYADCLKIKEDYRTTNNSPVIEDSKYKDEICSFQFDYSDNKVSILPISRLDKYFSENYEEIKLNHKTSLKIYGYPYVNSQRRFILPPIEIEFSNGHVDLLTAILTIFKNNTAVLRLTLPLNNVAVKPLIINDIDSYIISAKTFPDFPVALDNNSIDGIEKCYYKFLFDPKRIKSIIKYRTITNIILAKHSAVFEDIKMLPDESKEDIYKISIAPVPDIDGLSYREDAISFLRTNGIFLNGIGYIPGAMGRCVSVVDNNIINYCRKQFKDAHKDALDETSDEYSIFTKIIQDIRTNVEYSILILLLKIVNDGYTFERIGTKQCKLEKVKNDYYTDKIFISLLQSNTYGSVRELTANIENSMIFLLDSKNVEERMHAINCIVEDIKTKKIEHFQTIISILGLAITIVFGLPAINDTLSLIRTLCCFIDNNIPYLTISNCSFLIWLLISLGLPLCLWIKSKRSK